MQLQLPQLFIQLLKEIKDTIIAGNGGACNEKFYSALHDLHDKYDHVVQSGAIEGMMSGSDNINISPTAAGGNFHLSSFFFGIAIGLILWSSYNMYRKNQMLAAKKRQNGCTLSPINETNEGSNKREEARKVDKDF